MLDNIGGINRQNSLVALYSDMENAEMFTVGEILYEKVDELLLIDFAPDASFDGILYLDKKLIYRIEFESQYINELQPKIKGRDFGVDLGVAGKEAIKPAFIAYIKKEKKIVSLSMNESNMIDLYGKITDYEQLPGIVTIKQYTSSGDDDGASIIREDAITRMRIGGMEEEAVEKQLLMVGD